MENIVSNEKPLSTSAKAALMCGAGATIFLFYLLTAISVLVLLILIVLEFVLVIVALRFGLASVVIGIMRRHGQLLGLIFRSFRSRKGAEFRIELNPADAPGLFTLLQDLCGRLAVKVPDTVSLEMSVGAWVQLRGLHRGTGRTTLGIGFDLLAGLTQAEAEAVLAHEMVHAKLIRRGFKTWLSRGLHRMANLMRSLSQTAEAYRRAKISFGLLKFFLSVCDWLTRIGARQVAAYSRQDEFEADLGAAELCGSAPLRSSLRKLDGLARLASRLPWRERVAQLQLNKEGFSEWLMKELGAAEAFQKPDTASELFNKYSTHPTLQDRLAALPPVTAQLEVNTAPAIRLLADPDQVAARLVTEIQRVGAEEEQKDTKNLQRSMKKFRGNVAAQPLQVVGIILIIGSVIVSLYIIFGSGHPWDVWTCVLGVVAGVIVYRLGCYRDRVPLPIPDYAILKAAWLRDPIPKIAEEENKIETDLNTRFPGKKSAKKATLLAAESYRALSECDYLRAHVAARLCRVANPKSVEGAIGIAVASGALNNRQQASWGQARVARATGGNTPSTIWAIGWSALLLGDWASAEAYLDKASRLKPEEPPFHALRAIAQARRGKMQTAIISAREACKPQPRNKEYTKLLIDLLLDGGFLPLAQELLLQLNSETRTDQELIFTMVRVRLMQHNLDSAREWTALLQQNSIRAQMLIRLGGAYETARIEVDAETFYQQALGVGHYPEALLGLSRIEAERRNVDKARAHLLGALDVKRTLGDGAQGPLPLFHRIMGQLLNLQEPMLNCRAHLAKMSANVSPKALANQSFLIFAPSSQDAEKYLTQIISAMEPGTPPMLTNFVRWQAAPKDQQPDGPVRPGIQSVFS